MSPQAMTYPVDYFLCDQIILHLEHPDGIDRDTLADAINAFKEQEGGPWNQLESVDPASIIIFGSKLFEPEIENGRAISLVPLLTIEVGDQDPDKEVTELINLILKIHDFIYNAEQPLFVGDKENGIQLHGVAPNWLFGGTHHQSDALGGPASTPVEANPVIKDKAKFDFTNTPAGILSLKKSFRGGGVDVAILDTIPFKNDIEQAINQWHDHRLVESLFRSKNRLTIYDAVFKNWGLVAGYKHPNSPYEMPDHGLFIAGILRDIAPSAKLYLYEVLNEYGLGSLESIAWGLERALEDYKKRGTRRPLIFNCSLLLHTSAISGGELQHDDLFFPEKFKDPKVLHDLTYPFERIIERIMASGRIIVAAAGNEAGHNQLGTRPPARYPAAYEKVIGVGALPRIPPGQPVGTVLDAASYSNLADLPSLIGYMTLGGEPGNLGILGVYIHQFPHLPFTPQITNPPTQVTVTYSRNTNGWAYWAGTSFATPIICGILALANGAGKIHDAASAINYLDTAFPISIVRTRAGEKVIRVKQKT